jgi:uncharacterized protein (DUF885 family)
MLGLGLGLGLGLAACGGGKSAAPQTSTIVHDEKTTLPPSPLAGDAVAGVADPALRQVLLDHWEMSMRWDPVNAGTLGDHRFDALLTPRSQAAIDRRQKERDAVLDKARAVLVDGLNATDAVTWKLLVQDLETEKAGDVCRSHEWSVGASGPFDQLSYVAEIHRVVTPDDAKNLIARMKLGPTIIQDTMTNLRAGLAKGKVAPAETVRRAIAKLDTALAQPTDSWEMAKPAWTTAAEGTVAGVTGTTEAAAPWPAGERQKLAAELRKVVAEELKPAFATWRDFLSKEIAPKARTEKEGLAGMPDTEACYRASIFRHIGIERTPEELHALGQAEIARTDRELVALGKKVLGTKDLKSTLEKLRTDPKLYFTSGPELKEAAERSLAKAKAAIPKYFGILPKSDCVVREIPAHEAPYTTVAYYRSPHYDGSKPGEYFVNTYKPEVRPRFELEALTWHESIPGHHLQLAIMQELGELPAFRKLDGSTAFIEGWALYTERLADEMGLYTSDLDRLGKISYDSWRASRLVVDTGVHHLGWTRAQAETYMREHTALTFTNITNEVDRYISWPGQALAYKVGQLEILRLRAKAEAQLGKSFDIKGFHDTVLGAGAVTLPVLADRVSAWISSVQAAGGKK